MGRDFLDYHAVEPVSGCFYTLIPQADHPMYHYLSSTIVEVVDSTATHVGIVTMAGKTMVLFKEDYLWMDAEDLLYSMFEHAGSVEVSLSDVLKRKDEDTE